MKAAGVVVEYNPFHNGHFYHLQKAKEVTGADVMIAVMSGHFVQRGEPALLDKWIRTEMALKAGVDVVVELPTLFAVQPADRFADCAVCLLDAMCCQFLVFGSESGELSPFVETVSSVLDDSLIFNRNLQMRMSLGMSYPAAFAQSIQNPSLDLSQPNNILGFHYLMAICKQKLNLKVKTFERMEAAYHEKALADGDIASATSIRAALLRQEKVARVVPDFVAEIIKKQPFHDWEDYWPFLKYRLLSSTPEQLREIYEVKEGIEHRLQKVAQEADSFQHFLAGVKTKRYTWTRLQRICLYILLQLEDAFVKANSKPTAIHLLGFSSKGQTYLNRIKSKLKLPLLTKSIHREKEEWHFNQKAGRIYYTSRPQGEQAEAFRNEWNPPIRVN